MRTRGILITAAIGWAVLSGAAVAFGGPAVEQDTESRATAVLAEAGVDADVTADGRDLTVVVDRGLRDTAFEALRDSESPTRFDPRVVEVMIRDAPPPVSPPTLATPNPAPSNPADPANSSPTTTPIPTTLPPATTTTLPPATTTSITPRVTAPPADLDADPTTVAVRSWLDESGMIVLEGRVFSVIEQTALVITAERVAGAGRVTNRLSIVDGDTTVADGHVAGLVRIVELFGTGLGPVTAELAGGVVTITGARPPGSSIQPLAEAIAAGEADAVRFDLRLDSLRPSDVDPADG